MAAVTAKTSIHAVLGAATEDIVTLTQKWDQVEVLNRHATGTLYFTVKNVAVAAAGQNDTFVVPPGSGLVISVGSVGNSIIVRLLSTVACDYSVTGLAA